MSVIKFKQAGSLTVSRGWLGFFIIALALSAGYFSMQGLSKSDASHTTDNQATLIDSISEPREATETEQVLDSEHERRELVTDLAFNTPSSEVTLSPLEMDATTTAQIQSTDEAFSIAEEQRLERAEIEELVNETALEDLDYDTALPNDLDVDQDELRSLMKIDINYLIEQWRQAWQAGDSETYLSFYSSQFMPSGDLSYSSWLQERKRKVVPARQIELSLSNFDVVLDDNNQQSIVSFDQEYNSVTHSNKSRKQLTLIKESQWRIIAEAIVQ